MSDFEDEVMLGPPRPLSPLRPPVSLLDLQHHNMLHQLLTAHRLPTCDDFEDGPSVTIHQFDEALPATTLRYSSNLLVQLDKRLAEVTNVFAPTRAPESYPAGPSVVDTQRLQEMIENLSDRQRLIVAARHKLQPKTPTEYMVKYILAPLNEILRLNLLPTGLQMYWRLSTDRKYRARAELVYAPANHPKEILALVEIESPADLDDCAMRMFSDSLRRNLIEVDNQGKVVVITPLPPNHRSYPCRVVGRLLADMFVSRIPVAILTNCRRFIAIHNSGNALSGNVLFDFSDMITDQDVPGDKMSESPLGLFLSVTVFALRQRGLSLRANFKVLAHATTSSVLQNFLTDHFGKADKRKSRELRLKRCAVYDLGMSPKQLGRSSFTFALSPEFEGYISPETRLSASMMTETFYGPAHVVHGSSKLPTLLSDLPNEEWFTPKLDLADFRGRGSLWNAFSARFAWLPGTAADVVVKFCNLSLFPEESTGPYDYSRAAAEEALSTEVSIYTGPLVNLQGRVVPRFFGLLGSRQTSNQQCWAALFEDAGGILSPSKGHHVATRSDIRKMYSLLHDAGVIHGDVAWRHILCTRDGSLRLISFDRAVLRGNETAAEWAEKCHIEHRQLDLLLSESPAPPESDNDSDMASTTVWSHTHDEQVPVESLSCPNSHSSSADAPATERPNAQRPAFTVPNVFTWCVTPPDLPSTPRPGSPNNAMNLSPMVSPMTTPERSPRRIRIQRSFENGLHRASQLFRRNAGRE